MPGHDAGIDFLGQFLLQHRSPHDLAPGDSKCDVSMCDISTYGACRLVCDNILQVKVRGRTRRLAKLEIVGAVRARDFK